MSDHFDTTEEQQQQQPSEVVVDEEPSYASTTVVNPTETSSISNSVKFPNDNDNGVINTGSPEALAKGLSTMLSSVIRDFDSKAEDASSSQLQLSSAIDRLTGELDQLLEDAPLPFVMQHAAKLSNVRKRVSSLNLVLRSIQRRLDNIDRVLSMGLPNDKSSAAGFK